MLSISTHQPHHHSFMAHVSSSVQAGHAIVGPQVDVGPTFVHKVLDDVQVTFLAGQVEWGGPDGCLMVHTPALITTGLSVRSCCQYQPLKQQWTAVWQVDNSWMNVISFRSATKAAVQLGKTFWNTTMSFEWLQRLESSVSARNNSGHSGKKKCILDR